jgi:hypothetical protein
MKHPEQREDRDHGGDFMEDEKGGNMRDGRVQERGRVAFQEPRESVIEFPDLGS